MHKDNKLTLNLCGENACFEFSNQELKTTMLSKCANVLSGGSVKWYFKVKNVSVPYLKRGPVYFYYDDKIPGAVIKYGNIYSITINDKEKSGEVVTLKSPQSFLRVCKAIFYYIGLKRKCLFFHGAGIAKDKRYGYLFLGNSGMGKTTLCRNAEKKWRIFSDEISVVLPKNGKFYLYSNDFCRPYPSGSKIPLALINNVFVISRGKGRNTFERINRQNALSCLVRYLFVPNNMLDLNRGYFSSVAAFAQSCPVFYLKIYSFSGFLKLLWRNAQPKNLAGHE